MLNSKKKHGGNVWGASSQYGLEVDKLLDYSANISPLGTPERVKEAIRSSLDKLIHYPDPDSIELRKELSNFLGVDMENIIVGNGSVELIYLLAKMVRPKKALLLHPTFSEYEFAVTSEGGEIKVLELREERGFQIDAEEVITALDDVQIAFLCNPNNPTGCLTNRKDILAIIEAAAKKSVIMVIDEAFMDFIENAEEVSVIKEIGKKENLFILRSLTKFFALPGLRIGCGLGDKKMLEKMNSLREPWTVNILAQEAALEALRDEKYAQEVRRIIWEEKEYLYSELGQIPGIKPYRPSVNYVLLDITATGLTSTQIQEEMAQKGILVRNCNTYPFLGEYYIRVAVRTRPENIHLIEGLKSVLKEIN